MTSSLMYNRKVARGNWASSAVWGRTRSLQDSAKENSYLLESTLQFRERNYTWLRIENAGRTNELLVGEHPLPPGFKEAPLTHVQAYTFGYDRDVQTMPSVSTALGAQVTTCRHSSLQAIYGTRPVSVQVFVRIRMQGK